MLKYLAPLHKYILSGSNEICGIKTWFKLCGHKFSVRSKTMSIFNCTHRIELKLNIKTLRGKEQFISSVMRLVRVEPAFHISAMKVVNLPVLLSFCYLIIKVIAHCRLWCSGPFGTLLEVLIDEGPVSTIFKESRPPCHGRLDYFIPNNKQYVTWHSCVHSRGLEVWGLVSLVLWRDIKLVGYAK